MLIVLIVLVVSLVVPTRAEEEYGLIATLQSPTPDGYGGFGSEIALSEGLFLIGEERASVDDLRGGGKAYIFDSDGVLVSVLSSPTPRANEDFGDTVDVQGDIIVVGNLAAIIGKLEWAGKAHVFDSHGSLLYTLQSPQPKTSGFFGSEVAIGKDVILVGALGTEEGIYLAGSVHVYTFEGVHLTTLTSPSMKHAGWFGYALAANEEFILVGESGGKSAPPFVIGSVHVFDYDWNHVVTLQAPESKARANFGGSIAISGDVVVIGEDWADVEGHERAGRVHIFDTGWNHLATLQAPVPEDSGDFGIDVAVGGDIIVVGERKEDVKSQNEGKAYVFDLQGNLISTLTSPEPSIGTQFGWRVDTDGEIVVVAEFEATVDGEVKAGKVHIFQAGAAAFTSSGLNIDPSSVDLGGTLTISVEVTNTGAKSGTHTVALKIDGEVEDEKTVTVNPDETETVTFSLAGSQLGTFSVEIDGLSGSYTVTEPEEPTFWDRIPGFPYEAIILGLVAGVLILWMLQRRQ